MSAAAESGRRKLRLVRSGDGPDDLQVVLRATLRDAESTVLDLVDAALQSSRTYVIDQDGSRSVPYGVSVFALGEEGVLPVLSRLAMAPGFIRAAVGTIRRAGFEVLSTGENRDHFDIQLLPDRSEADADETLGTITDAAKRLMSILGPIEPNPAYAWREEEP